MSDEDIISVIQGVVTLIIEQERSARNILFNSDVNIVDEIFRAFGVLKYARAISAEESLDLLSKVRLGVSVGTIQEVGLEKIQTLISDIEPCSLRILLKEDISDIEEDTKRAEYIRGELD